MEATIRKKVALLVLFATGAAVLCLALVPGMNWGLNLGGSTLHLLAFGTLAAIGSLGCPGLNPLLLLAGLAGFGGSIELLQGWMAVGREAQLQDWFDDIKAATATITLISLVRLLPIDWRGLSGWIAPFARRELAGAGKDTSLNA